jgi:hypothetical protein
MLDLELYREREEAWEKLGRKQCLRRLRGASGLS